MLLSCQQSDLTTFFFLQRNSDSGHTRKQITTKKGDLLYERLNVERQIHTNKPSRTHNLTLPSPVVKAQVVHNNVERLNRSKRTTLLRHLALAVFWIITSESWSPVSLFYRIDRL